MTAELGREAAVEALRERRANRPERIDNWKLPAGSPMYYYCASCGHLADTLPEDHVGTPKKLCRECAALEERGWLEQDP